MHAELRIGDSKFMLADECPEKHIYAPKKENNTAVGMHLYVKKVDDVVKLAVKHGATLVREVTDMFYGDRSGTICDPYGHHWTISTHIEDVTPAQTRKRAEALFSK
jgi:PhnB protein